MYGDKSDGPMQLAQQGQCGVGRYIPPTVREQLQNKRDVLSAEITKIDAALSALDDNPGFEKVHDLLQKAL